MGRKSVTTWQCLSSKDASSNNIHSDAKAPFERTAECLLDENECTFTDKVETGNLSHSIDKMEKYPSQDNRNVRLKKVLGTDLQQNSFDFSVFEISQSDKSEKHSCTEHSNNNFHLRSNEWSSYDDISSTTNIVCLPSSEDLFSDSLLLTPEDYSIFANAGWSKREEEAFFRGIQRYSRFCPELIADLVKTKNTLQVQTMICSLDQLACLFPFKLKPSKHLRCAIQPTFKLRHEYERSLARILKEEKSHFKNDVNFDSELFNFKGWIQLSKIIYTNSDRCILGEFFVELKHVLIHWLRENIRKIRIFAMERERTFRRERRHVTSITDNDVNCHFEIENRVMKEFNKADVKKPSKFEVS